MGLFSKDQPEPPNPIKGLLTQLSEEGHLTPGGKLLDEDLRAWTDMLDLPVVRKVLLMMLLRARTFAENVAVADLTDDKSVKKAILDQGTSGGLMGAITLLTQEQINERSKVDPDYAERISGRE